METPVKRSTAQIKQYRERIHAVMQRVGAFTPEVPGDSILCQGLGLKGVLIARLSEYPHYVAFGARVICCEMAVHVVQAVLVYDSNDFWVMSDTVSTLNARVTLEGPEAPLLTKTLNYLSQFTVGGERVVL